MNAALAALFVVLALNPAAAATSLAGERPPRAALLIGSGAALVAYLLAIAGREAILRALSVEAASFLVAAGAVVAASGAAVILGRPAFGPVRWNAPVSRLVPLAVPLLLAPAPLAAAIAVALHASPAAAVAGVVIALASALALLEARVGRHAVVSAWLARLLAALAVVVAAGLIVDGVRTI